MKAFAPTFFVSLLTFLGLQLSCTTAAKGQDGSQAVIEEELSKSRSEVLSNRPYQLDPYAIKQVTIVRVKPALQQAQDEPEWWSQKQAYDLAQLLSLALSRYAGIKASPYQTWEQHLLNQEERIDNVRTLFVDATSNPLENPVIDAQMEILAYNFQHMPVKRRGIGLGIVAVTVKKCSTETYLKTSVSIEKPIEKPIDVSNPETSKEMGATHAVAMRLPISHLLKSSTGGASLNFNFLVGGAGGGNFSPPDKPLKQILIHTAVDAAEAIYCLITDQKSCLTYYETRPHPSPTALDDKEKRKVASC